MRVAIIPARGGSQRIPRKNIRDFKGKPMMQWPIEAAKASCLFDAVIVSTDDPEIAELARRLDCEVHLRPLDDGAVGTQVLAGRVLSWFQQATEACVIYPCSPMLHADDLRIAHGCWQMAARSRYAMSILPDNTDAGCFYFGSAGAFLDGVPLEGNSMRLPVDPNRFIDINTPEDWARAESMFNAPHP